MSTPVNSLSSIAKDARLIDDLEDRLAALESQVGKMVAAQVPNATSRAQVDKAQLDLINAVIERLAAVEQQLLLHRATSDVSERLAALERFKEDEALTRGAQAPVTVDIWKRLAAVERRLDAKVEYTESDYVFLQEDAGNSQSALASMQPKGKWVLKDKPVKPAPQGEYDYLNTQDGPNLKPAAPPAKRITPEQVGNWLDAYTIGNSHGATYASELVYVERLAARLNDFFGGK